MDFKDSARDSSLGELKCSAGTTGRMGQNDLEGRSRLSDSMKMEVREARMTFQLYGARRIQLYFVSFKLETYPP
jgi:hypothetical protein